MTRRALRKKKKRHPLRIILISVGTVIALAVGAVAVYAATLASKFESAERLTVVFPEEAKRPAPPEPEVASAQNILLLGSDTRSSIGESLESVVGLSDVIMVLHISADREDIHLMSIMRDSWVTVEGVGDTKVNSAMARGGIPLTVQTVETLIGSRIDHVAIVDFSGFKGLTDSVGGVVVDNPIDFYSNEVSGLYFAQGEISLNGEQALAYVRERYAFREGDFQRVRNQQQYLKALMSKVLRAETLTNPVTVSNLVGSISPYVALDSGFSSAYAVQLAFEMRNVRAGDVTFLTMPTLGTGREGNQSVVRVDWDELAIVQEHFRADTLAEYEPKLQTIQGPQG